MPRPKARSSRGREPLPPNWLRKASESIVSRPVSCWARGFIGPIRRTKVQRKQSKEFHSAALETATMWPALWHILRLSLTVSSRARLSISMEACMRPDLRWVLSCVVVALPGIVGVCVAATAPSEQVASHVPAKGPRTGVLGDKLHDFRSYCTTGEGASAFNKIKADFDRDYLGFAFPPEPMTYGDPNPKARTSEKADIWRRAQDVCGRVSGVAEAATVLWLVTGDAQYLNKAKE